MICHQDINSQNWNTIYVFYLDKKLTSSFLLRPGRNYAMLLCNIFIFDHTPILKTHVIWYHSQFQHFTISAFEFDVYYGFRAGAGVRNCLWVVYVGLLGVRHGALVRAVYWIY